MIWILAFILVAILVALIVIYKKVSSENEDIVAPAPIMSGADTTIEYAQVGDSVVIPGAGDNFQDLSFTIDRRDRYECDGEWYEVSGRYNGRRVFVEVSHDDDVEVLVNLANENLTLGDLGIREEDLVRMDDSHDTAESFSYNNSVWQFEGSNEIGYFKDCGRNGEGYYNWDFHEKGGSRKISIEKWEDEPFTVILSRQVNVDDVQVFPSR